MESQQQTHVKQSPRKRGLSSFAIFGFTILGCALLLAPSILWDFAYDQGTFAYGGSAILRGAKPYLDFWDIKPPNIFYVYALAFRWFGETVRAIRFFDFLNALTTIALIYLLSVRLFATASWRRRAAVVASLAFVLQYYIQGFWNTAQVETYSLPLILLAIWLLFNAKPHRKISTFRIVLSGLLLSLTFFFKFTNGIYLIVGLTALWLRDPKDWRPRLRESVWLSGTFAIGLLVQMIVMLVNGELLPLWHITTSSTLQYNSTNFSGSLSVVQNLRTALSALDMIWVGLATIGWLVWLIKKKYKDSRDLSRSVIFLLVAALLSLVAVQVQNKGYTYHYTILLPWAAMLIGTGIVLAVRALASLRAPESNPMHEAVMNAMTAFVLVVLFALSTIFTSNAELGSAAMGFYDVVMSNRAANGYIATDTLSNYVLKNTAPSDRIFVFGFEPYVYWKTKRTPATPFLNTIHFKPTYTAPEERAELVHLLTSNPPKLFLVETRDRYTSQGDSPDDSRTVISKRFPELESLLATQYTARDTIKGVIAYFSNAQH